MTDNPRPRRPRFPVGYGIAATEDGMLEWAWAVERLAASRTYWIATAKPDAAPHAAPVWGLWLDDAVVFSTAPESRKGRNLAHDPRVVIHLESGDEVVIIEGEAERIALDANIADAYEAKYAFRPEEPGGIWLKVAPRVAYAWLEADYPRTATRFDFR